MHGRRYQNASSEATGAKERGRALAKNKPPVSAHASSDEQRRTTSEVYMPGTRPPRTPAEIAYAVPIAAGRARCHVHGTAISALSPQDEWKFYNAFRRRAPQTAVAIMPSSPPRVHRLMSPNHPKMLTPPMCPMREQQNRDEAARLSFASILRYGSSSRSQPGEDVKGSAVMPFAQGPRVQCRQSRMNPPRE